jgi:Tfp pilus assembly protein FimT
MKLRAKAFTLMELIIIIVILAVLSVLLGTSYIKLASAARFNNAKTDIVSMIQKARSLSLSNLLINDDPDYPTDYYLLTIGTSSVSIDAYASDDSTHENLKTLTLDSSFSFSSPIEVYYSPPYGAVCFDDPGCTSTDTEQSTILTDTYGHKATFTIDVNGGYVEVQ